MTTNHTHPTPPNHTGGYLPTADDGPAEIRRLGGHSYRVGTTPDVLSLDRLTGAQAFFRLRVGDVLAAGDAVHLDRAGLDAPRVPAWEVVAVDGTTVTGRDLRTDEPTTWPREQVESGLATGSYATTLTDYVSTRVVPPVDPIGGLVLVRAHGDDGRSYWRRYRIVDPVGGEVVRLAADPLGPSFSPSVVRRLETRVRDALAAAGYEELVDEE